MSEKDRVRRVDGPGLGGRLHVVATKEVEGLGGQLPM